MELYIVDAFTEEVFGGNTAGVVLYDKLEAEIMQKLAAELRFSETAFVKKLAEDIFSIRYFTPNSEIELCGHATIAAFKVLINKSIVSKQQSYKIKTLAGQLKVFTEDNSIFMESDTPVLGTELSSSHVKSICSVLGISSEDLGDCSFSLIPQIISTGLFDIMLPVKTLSALNSINPDYTALTELSKELKVVGVHAFTLDAVECSAKCRNFAPLYGINEEAATGTSNASLTYYLYKNHIIKDKNRIYSFSQGENLGRPSKILTTISESNETKILVGGSARIISEGRLLL